MARVAMAFGWPSREARWRFEPRSPLLRLGAGGAGVTRSTATALSSRPPGHWPLSRLIGSPHDRNATNSHYRAARSRGSRGRRSAPARSTVRGWSAEPTRRRRPPLKPPQQGCWGSSSTVTFGLRPRGSGRRSIVDSVERRPDTVQPASAGTAASALPAHHGGAGRACLTPCALACGRMGRRANRLGGPSFARLVGYAACLRKL